MFVLFKCEATYGIGCGVWAGVYGEVWLTGGTIPFFRIGTNVLLDVTQWHAFDLLMYLIAQFIHTFLLSSEH